MISVSKSHPPPTPKRNVLKPPKTIKKRLIIVGLKATAIRKLSPQYHDIKARLHGRFLQRFLRQCSLFDGCEIVDQL